MRTEISSSEPLTPTTNCIEGSQTQSDLTSSNILLGLGIPVVFFLPVLLLARCCPVVSWFIEIMALLGCCPPSSSMENRSRGTEHMLVSERT